MSSLILKLTENGDFTLRGMSLPDGNQQFLISDMERDHDMMKTIIQEYAASHQAKAR